MKPKVIVGIVLAGLGTFILLKGLSYRSQSNVVSIGDLHASVSEQHTIPTWVGVVVIAAGVVLIVTGAGGRRAA
jgi:uncharacterized membrane protein